MEIGWTLSAFDVQDVIFSRLEQSCSWERHNPHGIAVASTPLAQHFTEAFVTPLIFFVVVLPVLYLYFHPLDPLSLSTLCRKRETIEVAVDWPKVVSQSGMPSEAPFWYELITEGNLLTLQLDLINCRIQLVWSLMLVLMIRVCLWWLNQWLFILEFYFDVQEKSFNMRSRITDAAICSTQTNKIICNKFKYFCVFLFLSVI